MLEGGGGSALGAFFFLNSVSGLSDVVSSVPIPRAYTHIHNWTADLTGRVAEDEERVEDKSESGGIQDYYYSLEATQVCERRHLVWLIGEKTMGWKRVSEK
jgi:hypothetical protein